jgi:hypothetical protein
MKTNRDLFAIARNLNQNARLNVTLNFGDGREPVDVPVADILIDDRGDTDTIDIVVELDGSEFQPKSDWKYYTYYSEDWDNVQDAIRHGDATEFPNLLPSEVETAKKLIGLLNDEKGLCLRLAAVQSHIHVMELDA